jgi:hypothetical protein
MTLAERPATAPPTLPIVYFADDGRTCAHTARSGCVYCRPRMFPRERYNFALRRMEILPALDEILAYAAEHPGVGMTVRMQ